ncbi:MAG: hypothetical protein KIT33_08440 [Candidatus Kapabacteria bacterium]|nr:hypothetical protein [Ignavibacteriota bacterium]MCW5884983.1 hypothetical protein [Candidatus Kapabacteria bacterium]
MKLFNIIVILVSFSSCSYYYVNIADGKSKKIRFVNEVVANYESVDSILTNSEFYDPNISKNIRLGYSFRLEFSERKLILYKNKKLTFYSRHFKHKNETYYDVLTHEISFLFEGSDKGIIAYFIFIDGKWILSSLIETNKDRIDSLYYD